MTGKELREQLEGCDPLLRHDYEVSRCAVHLYDTNFALLGANEPSFNNLMFTTHVRWWDYKNALLCPKFVQRSHSWWEKIKELFA
jgi:hypothetical protein